MADSDVKAVLKAFSVAFAAGDLDGMVACLGDDFVWTLPTGEADPRGHVVRGKEAARDYLRQRFFEDKANAPVFSDSTVEFSGDLAIVRYRVRAPGVDADGLEVYRVTDGKIRSKEAYWKHVSWPDA